MTGCACRAFCTCSATTSAGNCCRWSWGSAPGKPAGAGWAGGRRRTSSRSSPPPARPAPRFRCTGLVAGLCRCLPHPREHGGEATGPLPVDRGKTGSKHHLICDRTGTPLKVITTATNVNEVTQALARVDGCTPAWTRTRTIPRRARTWRDKCVRGRPPRGCIRPRRQCRGLSASQPCPKGSASWTPDVRRCALNGASRVGGRDVGRVHEGCAGAVPGQHRGRRTAS
jgi:hypothetical protein